MELVKPFACPPFFMGALVRGQEFYMELSARNSRDMTEGHTVLSILSKYVIKLGVPTYELQSVNLLYN